MFNRPHHQRIEHALKLLNAPLFLQNKCLFGGGTVIALMFGEYRESVDMDFLVSDIVCYRKLREVATGTNGISRLFKDDANATIAFNEVRADQYGIRSSIVIAGQSIKFEIVLEGRIALELPESSDVLCGVSTLTRLDMATSKLLANSDRWNDDSVFNRDVIDLAMMQLPLPLLRNAVLKAESAYGTSIRQDLNSAIDRLENFEGWLDRGREFVDGVAGARPGSRRPS
ncbi:MAG: hypothetical protein EB015_22990, partial [Methylocystaceae bacterium]|nr:hypothetical protein [Methylocystaceae bacterium]